jgi:NADH-quinone oxidoreductase subunit D
MTWDQAIFLVERICGICSNSHPFAYVCAVEDCGKIEVPERAEYIRTIVDELQRLHSHFLWVGLAGHFLGYNTVWMWFWRYREPLLDLMELITGNRNHYAMMKIGGVRRDIRGEDIPEIEKTVDLLEQKTAVFTQAVLDDPVIRARLEGVGILTTEDAIAYSVLGPTARGSGVPIDVRKDHPNAAYGWVPWDMIVFDECDLFAKAKVRLLECLESVKIIRECLKRMKPGPICADVHEIPPGEGVGHIEAPRGEVFHYVRSDGSIMPARHKVRAPSFMNVASNVAAVKGCTIADAILVLASVDPCYCCTERVMVLDGANQTGNGNDLIRLSQAKTERLARRFGEPEERLRRLM